MLMFVCYVKSLYYFTHQSIIIFSDTGTDEDQIGASYDQLEWIIHCLDSNNTQQGNRQKQVLTIYNNRHSANLHKMMEIPCCIIPPELKSKPQL
jgi:NAD+ synthase